MQCCQPEEWPHAVCCPGTLNPPWAAGRMVRSAEARRRTAYHESGHALVAVHTPGALDIHKATIVPRGHALGLVAQARPRPSSQLQIWLLSYLLRRAGAAPAVQSGA